MGFPYTYIKAKCIPYDCMDPLGLWLDLDSRDPCFMAVFRTSTYDAWGLVRS